MDFFEVLDRVVDLLRSRGRVTYGALKLQFQLDDAQVEVLKDELIYAQHLAVDEDGRVLVWMGEASSVPPSPSIRTAPADSIQDVRPTQPSSPAIQPPAPDAERRQLTVMFCDLVGSTDLSGQLDPEQLREVVRIYQETAAAVIQRYEGYVAQYLGDGLLIYFGYPGAHEDDAVRAVHTGLGILDRMSTVNPRLQSNYGVQLAVRIGVHTGPVVVGKVGGGRRHEQLALGATPNVAAHLEGMAPPNTVVISEATYRLVSGYFTSKDLGTHTLRGVAAPVQVYRIIGASGAQTRLEVTAGRGFTPLVGREQEAGLLAERWTQVKEGIGHVVLFSGEAGIGKSRVVEVAKEIIGNEPHTRVECRSSPYYQNTALYPFIDLFQRILQWNPDDSPEAKADKLEQLLSTSRLPVAETVPLLAALLSLPLAQERYPTLQLTPQRQRQKTLEVLLALVFDLAARQPVLFILEDLHWTDPTTLEWLGLLIDQIPTASMLLLLTHRPEFEPSWGVRSYLTSLPLDRLTQVQVETMVERVAEGKRIPAAVMRYLVHQTDGVPLFVEEMTKALLESKVLEEMQDQYELRGTFTSLAVPATLQDSLMARLDRLGMAKGVAQLGATLGRTFTYDLLQAVSSQHEAVVQHSLAELVEAGLLYQLGRLPQATFTFKHALIQETAYQSLLRSTRQQHHQRIARVLETRFPATDETQPELLAHHFTEAGLHAQATSHWQRAGQHALERSANVEAVAHLTQGLQVLGTLPDTPERAQQELVMQITLGPSVERRQGSGGSRDVADLFPGAGAL